MATHPPPPWYGDAVQFRLLFSGAWDEVSRDWAEKLVEAFRAGDDGAIAALLERAAEIGIDLGEVLGDKVEALSLALQSNAAAYWRLYGPQLGIPASAAARAGASAGAEAYRRTVAGLHAQQMKMFAEANPSRILHPGIMKHLEDMRRAPEMGAGDTVRLAERMGRIADKVAGLVKQDAYWSGMSDVHAARMWHADGLRYAADNGVTFGMVSGPLDEKTCDVCRVMLGAEIDVRKYLEKIDKTLLLKDPEEYVAAWKFPRFGDVDNMSRAALARKMVSLPPFHNHCRHYVVWKSLRRRKGVGDAG